MAPRKTYKLKGRGRNTLNVYTKSFGIPTITIFDGERFNSNQVPEYVYKKIVKMMDDAYERGRKDERRKISNAFKNFKNTIEE